MCRAVAVTWCACLVRVTCDAFKKESAVPADAISAWTRASTQPLPSSQSPTMFRAAISIWSPPKIIMKFSSPWVSGKLHCICLAMAYSGWSTVITGIWFGFTCWTASLITFIPCLIMAGDFESSWNRGRIEVIAEGDLVSGCLLAWYAAQDLLLSPQRFPRSLCSTVSSHL